MDRMFAKKVLYLYLSITGSLFVVTYIMVSVWVFSNFRATHMAFGNRFVASILPSISAYASLPDYYEIEKIIRQQVQRPEIHEITLIDSQGQPLLSAQSDAPVSRFFSVITEFTTPSGFQGALRVRFWEPDFFATLIKRMVFLLLIFIVAYCVAALELHGA